MIADGLAPSAPGHAAASQRPCPICSSERSRLLYRQRFMPLDGTTDLEGYDVVFCEECGFGFADGVPSQSFLDQYYRDMSKYGNPEHDGGVGGMAAERYARLVADLEHRIEHRPESILDVGCANGHLLNMFQAAGYRNLLGLDPSPASGEAARRLYGIDVRVGSLFDVPVDIGTFEIVCVHGILEHIRDLARSIESAKRLLARDGLLYVEVPNAAGFAPAEWVPFQQFSLEHINFFSAPSLSNALGRAGFEPVAVWTLHTQLSGLYRIAGDRGPSIAPDAQTPAALERYVEHSRKLDAQLAAKLAHIAAQHRDVTVWGAGTLTRRLLRAGSFDGLRIARFADANVHYHGRRLNGIPIVAPADLAGHEESIVIVAPFHEREIGEAIRDRLGLPNPFFFLFEGRR